MTWLLIFVQLESVIDEVLKNGNIQSLHEYLEGDKPESAPIHCSQQFLTKLDRFIKKVSCCTLTSFPQSSLIASLYLYCLC